MDEKNNQINKLNKLLDKCMGSYYKLKRSGNSWVFDVPKNLSRKKELELLQKSIDIIVNQGYEIVWNFDDEVMIIYKNSFYFAFYTYNEQGELLPRVSGANHLHDILCFTCLHCGFEAPLSEENNFSEICDECGWRMELVKSYAELPLKRITDKFGICYPPIFKSNLTHLPKKLKNAVKNYFRTSKARLSKAEYQLIFHSLFRQDAEKFKQLAEKYNQKAKLTTFFQNYSW